MTFFDIIKMRKTKESEIMVKLRSLIIENIKNVQYGVIDFQNKSDFINVTGIYGQNGSGKTAVVDVFEVLSALMRGESIPQHTKGIFNAIDQVGENAITLELEVPETYIIRYKVEFAASEPTGMQDVMVVKEELAYKPLEAGSRYRYLLRYEYEGSNFDTEQPRHTGYLKSQRSIMGKDAVSVLTKTIIDDNRSFIFSKELVGFIYTSSKQDLSTLVEIYNVIQDFYQNLRIFTQELSSLNSSGVTPITINYQNRDSHVSYQGIIPMFLQSGGISINEEIYSVYESTIDYLNEIVPIIIPDLKLEMEAGEIEIRSDGQKIRNVSFISNRAGKRFSLKHESEGIRKIISMLGFLVEVYNKENIIAVIDELDAGVFEYLLGELIEIFSESAKGQLIFTSHNLRVLEKLPSYKVVFSTACPTNRYIRLTGIKPSNNLRDIYLRGIQLGGHEEELYQGVSNSKIKRALRKAGIKLGE